MPLTNTGAATAPSSIYGAGATGQSPSSIYGTSPTTQSPSSIYQTYLACDADMDPDGMTAIATPECVASYRACVAKWKMAGMRRVVRDTKMMGSAIIRVMIEGSRQAIVVRLISTGVRCTQDIGTGATVQGSAAPESFTEFGTFVRPPGITTPKSAGAGARRCSGDRARNSRRPGRAAATRPKSLHTRGRRWLV